MADHSTIEWTEATWNPITGCTKVSPGCDHCYIERTVPFRTQHRRFDKPGIGGTTGVTLHPDRLDQPLRWRKPRRVFVNSLSDLFHDAVPDAFIAEVFARMWWSPLHTFQILTKRPGRMRSLVPRIEADLRQREGDLALVDCPTPLAWPLPNVWLGVSVEDQQRANLRIPALLATPAAVRWLSCEPLLGQVDLTTWSTWSDGTIRYSEPEAGIAGLDWVVAGGESGPGARPMHPDWARALRDQCTAAGMPFFFKQWGEARPLQAGDCIPDRRITHVAREPDGTYPSFQLRVGKKAAGRELDGRTWDEYPAAT